MPKSSKTKTASLSVVVPIYNERELLERNMLSLRDFLISLHTPFEIILSENGSTDGTKSICLSLQKKDKRFHCVFSKNPSYGDALRAGVDSARLDIIVIFPADLWGLNYLKKSLTLIGKYPVVVGSRHLKQSVHKRSLARLLISKAHTPIINSVFRTKFTDVNGLKMYRAPIAKRIFALTRSKGAFIEVEIAATIANSKIPYIEIPLDHIETKTRHLKYFFKIVYNGISEIASNYARLKTLKIQYP